ncbi:MAG: hypothetical protein KC645_06545, partial [Gemmatimonadetes bacterium]|nr:hypothetical protein [Gemmatimonadota bacterium]
MTLPLRCLGSATMLVALAAPVAGQDQFGRSVAIAAGDVVVTKPVVGRGPAMLYVFASDGTERARLVVGRSAETGEGVSPSVAADGAHVLVGSGDPGTRLAGHLFGREDGGTWSDQGSLPLDAARRDAAAAGTLDFAGILRILEPPARIVALDGARALAAVVGGPGAVDVRVLERAQGEWRPAAVLPAPAGADVRFGSALRLDGARAYVGAPGLGGTGAVFVFERDDAGAWSEVARLGAVDLPPGSRLGEALAIGDDVLVAGAPGFDGSRGAVLAFARDASGGWTEVQRLEGGEGGDSFGAALALSDGELWVGAPQR